MRNIIKSTTFLAILACWLWSTAFVGVKIGLTYHTPLQFAGVRFFISGILIFLYFGKPARYFAELKANLKFILKLSLVQTFIQYSLFYSGLNLVPSSLAAMIIGSQPMFIALVAHFSFHNDKMTPLKTGSILIGVAGIAVITLGRSGVEMKGSLEYLGIALLLVNNMVAGYSNVMVAKHSQGISPAVISSTSLMIGGVLLSVVSVPVEGIHLGPFPPEYWYALAWLSFLSAAAFTIWNSLLKRPGVKVSLLNVWKFLIPVSGATLSWIIMKNENPDTLSLTGMAIIALSLLSLNYANRRAQKQKAGS
ncbi:DMT family transporter [Maribellus sp. YY47]|uniref:DMT family transporter n=1 Tax=Maribellus sp. YY47 TaxID=2929486 RepID=UPI002001C5D8|nr:DMT family transporter [Maribellus sp. YY47]MCK3683162.1 DMT family transporter [Maribellus sp. YY47]